jgi:hypothetical protein
VYRISLLLKPGQVAAAARTCGKKAHSNRSAVPHLLG